MSLPKISHPTFKIDIPSLGKELRFRPFTVKEEKILLVAQSTENIREIFDSILQVINNCCVDDDLDVNELTSFDVDYLFIKLRARSVNNVVKIDYRDEEGDVFSVDINLDEVKIKYFEGHEDLKVIPLSDDNTMGIVMRYPKPDIVSRLDMSNNGATVLGIVRHCIDKVYDEDNVHNLHDGSHTDEEVTEFVDSLPPVVLEKVSKFFETMPRLQHTVKYTNKAGEEKEIVLQSLSDFFTLG